MRTTFRTLFVILAVLFMAACNNDSTKSANGNAQTAAADNHEHTYRCPMNCENGKTYEKEGKCPVCGMKLEHYDGGTDNGLTYKMEFKTNPAQLEAGKEGSFALTPKIAGREGEAVALDVVHEKKIHLIVVSDDLSYFEHIHPEYSADGSYQIKVIGKGQSYSSEAGKNETRFENGGNYFLFADYQPTGGLHQVEKIPLKVAGPAKGAASFKENKLTGTSGAYSVTLAPAGGNLVSGVPAKITGTVMSQGKEVDPNMLENYLGAKAHMVVISLNEKEYLHVHPDVAGGKFELNTTFKNPGIYRGWIQFQSAGKVHTIDFTMNVAPGSANNATAKG
jgi:hypothetical protein